MRKHTFEDEIIALRFERYAREQEAALIEEDYDLALVFARSRLLDVIKGRAMSDTELKKAYEELQVVIKRVAPHWSIYNAITNEMERGYRNSDSMEKILCLAMRRLQDGLLFDRWLGRP